MDNFYQTQRPYNPYQNQAYTIPYIGNITSVKGAEGCNAFKMGANSSVLLLDEDNPIVWIVRTDGAGYKKDVIPYSITPYVPEPPIDLKALNERLTKMEAILYGKSDSKQTNEHTGQHDSDARPVNG